MHWNTAILQALLNTSLVCFGAAGLALGLGLFMAVLTTCFRLPFRNFLSIGMLSMILVPVYVQAAAWSAGFGAQGWLRLSQVAAAISNSRALASVIWIHATSLTPVTFLLCVLGLKRAFDSNARQALLDFGPWYTTTRVLIPKAWPWIAVCLLWAIAITGNDMVVTNLFQVPTLTETVYQQVQFNELNWASIGLGCLFAILVAAFTTMGAFLFASNLGGEASSNSEFEAFPLEGCWRWLGTVAALTIVSVVTLVPISNLIVKAGWQSQIIDGSVHRHWSLWTLLGAIGQIGSFAEEFGWSMQLCLYASCLAMLLSFLLLVFRAGKWTNATLLGVLAFSLATPGPIVNLAIMKLFNLSNSEWIAYLADRTLACPIVALQSRCLPITFLFLWLADSRFHLKNDDILRLDRGLPWSTSLWVRTKAMTGPMVFAFVISAFTAFADLSSYLLVQPPGVTTVAMRMFDLLHYGVKNQEAALALVLASISMSTACLLLRR
jgi:ABC-type Fe3+ transport system permease subunit